jgi:hypothetical protein
VVERLFLGRAAFLRQGFVPFLGVRELGINIEDDPAKRVLAVPDDLSDMIFGACHRHRFQPLFGDIIFYKGCLSNPGAAFCRKHSVEPGAAPAGGDFGIPSVCHFR